MGFYCVAVTGLPMVTNVSLAIAFLINVLLSKAKSDAASKKNEDASHARNFERLVKLCRKKLSMIVHTRFVKQIRLRQGSKLI